MRDSPIELWRGSNDPAVIWEFLNADGTPADLTGSIFTLTVGWPAGQSMGPSVPAPAGTLVHSSDPAADPSASALVVDLAAGRVTWPFTVAESEQIPRGLGPRYELTRTLAGKVRLFAGGTVTVRGFLP